MSIDHKADNDGLEPLYSFKSVAEALDVSERTVRRWADNGALVTYRLGRQRRVSQSDLEKFLRVHRDG